VLVAAGEDSYESQLPGQVEAQVATMSMPASCGLDG